MTEVEIIEHKAVKHVPCTRCGRGRKLRRTKTFKAELLPGQDRGDVTATLVAQADEWTPTASHPPCQCPYFTDPS